MMKSKGIILIAMLCIVALSGCSKEINTTAADSETSSTQIIHLSRYLLERHL